MLKIMKLAPKNNSIPKIYLKRRGCSGLEYKLNFKGKTSKYD